ncbi:hypothetical protein GH714_011197 [Hevea brasiliensis]|uniref:Reverse transcriptase zinc-binding domain-containing protein n=1 Tax=Hevea brasiliensis TaxID=3981 RepID=A0A6A6M182_HEVBR|nr:hypothetical protein GH714_011197 [Hevea brasiliensis]
MDVKKSTCSSLWREVSACWSKLSNGVQWSIGNGRKARFWLDCWVAEGIFLQEVANDFIPQDWLHQTVDFFVTPSGDWNWSMFSYLIPEQYILLINAILPPHQSYDSDSVLWGSSPDGSFTLKSAYALIRKDFASDNATVWRSVWRWFGPFRVNSFLWLIIHGRLLTNVERCRRHLSSSSACQLCSYCDETTLHVLRDCPFTALVWNRVFQLSGKNYSAPDSLVIRDWIFPNLVDDTAVLDGVYWCSIFGLTCWALWKRRNFFVFRAKEQSAEEVVQHIFAWTKNHFIAVNSTAVAPSRPARSFTQVSWVSPRPSWITINTDGAYKSASCSASAGGLLQDSNAVDSRFLT